MDALAQPPDGDIFLNRCSSTDVFEFFGNNASFAIDLGVGGNPAEVWSFEVLTTVTNGSTFDYTFTITTEPLDSDNDGLPDDVDLCPGTALPDPPTRGLKKNRYAASIDGFASTDGAIMYTLADTGGCSATQIIAEAGLGNGQTKFGISGGALEEWITNLA